MSKLLKMNLQLFAGSSTATAEKALKEFFLQPAIKQLDERSGPFLAMLEKTTEGVSGSGIVMPLKYGRSGGIGARPEDVADTGLPEPNARKWTQGKFPTKNIFGVFKLTDKLIKASKDNKGAFAEQLSSQMEDLTVDANDSLRRQVHGDGTGIMATLEANTSTTTLKVDTVKYFSEGQIVDICASDGTPKATKREILVRDKAANTITISGAAITTISGDIVTAYGSYQQELTGLSKIMTPNTTIYGIDRSQAKWFNPIIKDNGGADLTGIIMEEVIDEIDIEKGSKVDFIMAPHDVVREYKRYMESFKRNIEQMEMKGGYSLPTFDGIPISKEKYAKDGAMSFLCSENFKVYHMGDFEWMDRDGAILTRVGTSYMGVMVRYMELGCNKIGGQAQLQNININ